MSHVCKYPSCSAKATGLKCNNQCPALSVKKQPGSAGKNTIPRKTGICKQTPKAKTKAINKSLLVQNDAVLYLEIWEERLHICFECGEPITEHFSINLFHHVLGKRKSVHDYSDYSQYRHCRWNLVLLHYVKGCHTTADGDNAPKTFTYKQKLIALHNAGKLAKVSPDKDFIDGSM